MNMQAMMQQAQKLQKEISKIKEEINEKTFENTKSFVKVVVNGKKEVLKIEINKESFDKDDIEAIEDLITLSLNEAFKEVDKESETKLSKYGMGSLGF